VRGGPKGNFRGVLGVSRDVLPPIDVADERVAVDERLGRDRGSSFGPSVTAATGSITGGRLNLHVGGDLSQEDACSVGCGSVRSDHEGAHDVDKLEVYVRAALESPLVRADAEEGADPWFAEISEEIEGRLAPNEMWKLRRGDGDGNLR